MNAFIPYGIYWSSPFAKWQGTLANLNALPLAAAVGKQALAARGYDLAALRARQVSPADLSSFDYVLAMDRANLAQLEQLALPGPRAHLGLFLEFTPGLESDEVPDPYYGGTEDFERVLDLCEAGARALLKRLERGG